MDATTKVRWLMDRGWLFDSSLRHEAVLLLQDTYPQTKADTKEALVGAILHFARQGKGVLEVRLRVAANLLSSLAEREEQKGPASSAFATLSAEYPKIQPSEHPERQGFMFETYPHEEVSPRSASELLSQPPEPQLDFLISFRSDADHWEEPSRSGLLVSISEACRDDVNWGIALARALSERGQFSSDVWDAILGGWVQASLTEADWPDVLGVLQGHRDPKSMAFSIATFLETKARNGVPPRLLSATIDLAGVVLAAVRGEAAPTEPDRDWLNWAINRTGGRLANAILYLLSRGDEPAPTDVEDHAKEILTEAFRHDSADDVAVQVIAASQIHFLLARDRAWTADVVLPTLDWDVDADRARRGWDGVLTWTRLTEQLVEVALPMYRKTVDHLGFLKDELRDRLCQHLAFISVLSSETPSKSDLLPHFIAVVEERDRIAWAKQLVSVLESLPNDALEDTWTDWLKQYWSGRLEAIPRALDGEEAAIMTELPVYLAPVFDEAVDLARATPSGPHRYRLVYERLKEDDFASTHPRSTALLLQHLLAGEEPYFFSCDEPIEIVRTLQSALDDDSMRGLEPILDQLTRLGCNASSLGNGG